MENLRVQHGHITKKSGAWIGHYAKWITDPDTGEKKRQQKAFKVGLIADMTKADARRALSARIQTELGLRGDSRATVAWFIEHRWRPMREGSWRESTKVSNLYLLSLITNKFGAVALEDADAVEMQSWVNDLAKTKSKSVVQHVRIFLKSIFLEAVEQDFIRKSPARMLRVPSALKSVAKPFLTIEQVKQLLEKAEGQDRVMLRVELVTGLRPSELLALEWHDLDMRECKLNIKRSVWVGRIRQFTKTTDAESSATLTTVYLPQSIVDELRQLRMNTEYDYPDNYIFGTKAGGLRWRAKANEELKVLGKAAGIDGLNFQMLRRTVATLAQSVGNPKDIQTILRHRKPETAALHYTQPQEHSVRLAVDQLDAMLTVAK